jgi:hypothetical protein
MNNSATIKWILAGAFGIAAIGLSSASAQSALGGAKTQQNKLGGVTKPAPVIGGATIKPVSPPSPPKPAPVVGLAKPNTLGTPAPASTNIGATPGQTAGAARQNPPVTPPNKGGTVVTTSSNLKCGSGACTSRGPKP